MNILLIAPASGPWRAVGRRGFANGRTLRFSMLSLLTVVGTAAMLWVGGHILLNGTHELHWDPVYDWVHDLEHHAHEAAGSLGGVVGWGVNTLASGLIGLAVGGVVVLVVSQTLHRNDH